MYPFFKRINNFIEQFASFLSGEKCYKCGRYGYFICESCLSKLPHIKGHTCSKCLTSVQGDSLYQNLICGDCLINPPPFEHVYSPFWYENCIRDLMHDIKFGQKYYYISRIFQLIREQVSIFFHNFNLKNTYIVPIPLSRKRKLSRGYNQSYLIAKELSKIVRIPILKDYLIKTKELQPMMTLSREDRFKNIKGAFLVAKKINVDRIILVDDIITTTATVREACNVLKKGGCNEIYIFALCRAKN